jgi:hypothetical protein
MKEYLADRILHRLICNKYWATKQKAILLDELPMPKGMGFFHLSFLSLLESHLTN